jgi:hypothetical protein
MWADALWAYRTAHKLTTGYTPFQLTFRFEAVIPMEYEIPSLRLAVQHKLGETGSLQARLLTLEKLDELRRRALWCNEVTQMRKKTRHDSLTKRVTFTRGNLVMLIDNQLMKQHGQRFIPKWKGRCRASCFYRSGKARMSCTVFLPMGLTNLAHQMDACSRNDTMDPSSKFTSISTFKLSSPHRPLQPKEEMICLQIFLLFNPICYLFSFVAFLTSSLCSLFSSFSHYSLTYLFRFLLCSLYSL